jgi:hypothetical protein
MKQIGAFEPIKGEVDHRTKIHNEELYNERWPQHKSDKDRQIREGALRQSSKEMAYLD